MMNNKTIELSGPAAAALAARLLDEKKARDIQVLDVRQLCGFADFFVIASVDTGQQLRGLAEAIRYGLKQGGHPALVDEQVPSTTWAIIDAANIVVHIFLPEARLYYNLERLWGDADELDWQNMEGADEAAKASRRLLANAD